MADAIVAPGPGTVRPEAQLRGSRRNGGCATAPAPAPAAATAPPPPIQCRDYRMELGTAPARDCHKTFEQQQRLFGRWQGSVVWPTPRRDEPVARQRRW